MPGNPAILEGVPAALSAAELLNNVAVKLPPFWPDNIETWFVQAESKFGLRAVTVSQTKFDFASGGHRRGPQPHQEPSH